MWKCRECGSQFDEPDKATEKLEYWGAPATLEYEVCPNCKSEEVTEMAQCRFCLNYTINYLCDECQEIVKGHIATCIKRVAEELRTSEDSARDIVNDMIYQ